MDRDIILAAIDQAFGHLPRPETMVRDPNHREECAEHEAVMQSVTPQSVTLKEIGNPGWDPVCYLTDEAFCYFMPGLSRLALDKSDAYLSEFLFHLGYNQGERVDAFTDEQRRATAQLIDCIHEITLNKRETTIDRIVVDIALDELERVREKFAGE